MQLAIWKHGSSMSSGNIRSCQDLEDTSDKTFFVDTNAIGNETLSWIQDRCSFEGKQPTSYFHFKQNLFVYQILNISRNMTWIRQ